MAKESNAIPVVKIRAKDGDYLHNLLDYEKWEKGRWIPVSKAEIQQILNSGQHVLWNP